MLLTLLQSVAAPSPGGGGGDPVAGPSEWVRGLIYGDDWNRGGAPYPWRPFGYDADLVFTWDARDFAARAGTGLSVASASLALDAGLEQVGTIAIIDGTINARIRRNGTTRLYGAMMAVRLHITLSDGQHDDRTFLLKNVPR
jgi:hypothetical protein